MIRRRLMAQLGLFVLASTIAFASTQGTFDRTFQVTGPVDLAVQTHSGDITVRTGPAGSVSIRGKIYVGDHWLFGSRHTDVTGIQNNPPVRQDGNNIRIDYVNVRDISVDYEITVPEDTTIRSQSGSGDQMIEGTRGNADLQSGSGNLKVSRLTGEIRLQTGSGDITARGVHGAFRAEAGSGDITAEGTQTGEWQIRTGSGNVHVHLPADSSFDADISTSSGTLDIDTPITTTVQGRVNESHKTIVGKVRGGGPLLTLRTGSGDIHIE